MEKINKAHKIPQRKNIFEAIYSKISKPISVVLFKTFLTPNQITIISGLFGIIGAYLLTCDDKINLIYAAIFIQLFTILDLVDGDIARMKGMQSYFGKWLDIQFDKFNDLLIILGLSVGVFLRTNNISALYLGIILMGLVFFIQFSMVMNSIIHRESEKNNKSDRNNLFYEKKEMIKNIPLFYKVKKIISKHLLLEHCTFLFFVSFFVIINQIEWGLWFLVCHAFLTYLYVTVITGIRIIMNSSSS